MRVIQNLNKSSKILDHCETYISNKYEVAMSKNKHKIDQTNLALKYYGKNTLNLIYSISWC